MARREVGKRSTTKGKEQARHSRPFLRHLEREETTTRWARKWDQGGACEQVDSTRPLLAKAAAGEEEDSRKSILACETRRGFLSHLLQTD